MAKPLRCYLGFHRWQSLKAEGGEGWYKECRDCRKFKDIRGQPGGIVGGGGDMGSGLDGM
jgi:hypothetical protein